MAGLSFTSVDQMEVGRGVGGPAISGPLRKLNLQGSHKVRGRTSDVSENFKCCIAADGKITATSGMQ